MLVYKYRGGAFDRDLVSISQDYFWAASVDSLNDPCEATFENRVDLELSAVNELFGVQSKSIASEFSSVAERVVSLTKMTDKLGVFSLSKSHNHQLLWAHYADSHKGFCVEYDVDVLRKQQLSFANHYELDVIYSDSPGKIGLEHMMGLIAKKDRGLSFLQTIIGTKSKSWEYEKEIRLITDNFGRQNYDYRAVKSIFFGIRMEENHKRQIMDELKGRSIKYYQMTKMHQSYDLVAIPERDIFHDASPYLYKISPVQDNVVPLDEVEGKWKDYSSYLTKAVEVQRRDPYCYEVCYAAFSVYDSKPNNPIVYVNYKYSADGYMNRSFTLSELDKLYAAINDL